MYRPNIDYDYNLESSVLGIFIAEPDAFGSNYSMINRECFYSEQHALVYDALSDRFHKGHPIDLHTVTRYFWEKGMTDMPDGSTVAYFVTNLLIGVFSSAHIECWCMMLRELSAKRLMLSLTNSGMKSGDVFDEAQDIEKLLQKALEIKNTDDWQHISQVAVSTVKAIEARSKDVLPGVTTSISLLDKVNGGFRPGDLVIIGARPSVGKSAFLGRLSTHAAFDGKGVGIISLEMSNDQIFTRMAASDSETTFRQIDRNDMDEDLRQKVYGTISSLSTLPIYFSDTAEVNIWDIRAKAEKLRRKHDLKILFIDYLQLVEPENDKKSNREQEVAKISRGLKKLAKTMQIPIVILAQLNRAVMEKGDNKPQLHHLRESGSIEQDADIVMFLHRDFVAGKLVNEAGESTEREADLLVRKWRNGAQLEIKIGFEPAQMRFYDLDLEQRKKEPEFFNPRAGIPGSSKLFIPGGGFQARSPLPPESDENPF